MNTNRMDLMKDLCHSGWLEFAKMIDSVAKQQLNITKIHWKTGDILTIENWLVLHGRDEVLDFGTNWRILRVLVR